MNKSELVTAIASTAGLTKVQAGEALNAFIETVEKTVTAGDDVVLVGFGTFSRKETKDRKGRNPQTGEPITIKGGKKPMFKPGKQFKDAVGA